MRLARSFHITRTAAASRNGLSKLKEKTWSFLDAGSDLVADLLDSHL